MRKTFTPCHDNFGKLTQNTGVTAGPVACPSVVCCTTNTNHIKNNYKDDSANAVSFSFIQKNNLNTTAFMKTFLRSATNHVSNFTNSFTSRLAGLFKRDFSKDKNKGIDASQYSIYTPSALPTKSTTMKILLLKSKIFAFIIAGLFFVSGALGQTTTITSPNTVNASTIPVNNAIIINAGGTLNIDAANTFASITTANAGTSTISGTGTLTVTGNVSIVSSNTLTLTGLNFLMNVGGSWSNGGTFTAGTSTVNFNSTTTGNTIAGTLTGTSKFNKLIFNGIGGAWSFSANADIASDFTITNGTVTAPSGNLNVGGNWSNSGTFNHNNGTVIFNGIAAQDIGGTSSTSFYYLTITNSSAAVTASTNFNVSNTLTLSGVATILNPGSGVVINSGGSAGTISGTGTIKVTRTTGTPDFVNQYKFSTYSIATMTVDYAGTGNQTVNQTSSLGNNNYGALIISGNAGNIKSLQGAVYVNGNVTITTATLDAVTNTLYVGGNWTNNGVLATNGTVEFNGGNAATIGASNFNNITFSGTGIKTATGALTIAGNVNITNNFTAGAFTHTVGGSWANSNIFNAGTSTIIFNSTSTGNTISGNNLTGTNKFNNLTFNGIGGAWSFSNNADIGGNFTITNGTVTNANVNLNIGGNWTNNSGNFSFLPATGTVTFNGTTLQTISGSSATNFYNLTISNTIAAVTANTNFNVLGTLNI